MEEGYTFAQSLFRQFGSNGREGPIVDGNGNRIGTHTGVHNYTIGQRRNLGVNTGFRMWVEKIDAASDTVVLTDREGTLNTYTIYARDPLWTGREKSFSPQVPFKAYVKIRYLHTPALATVEIDDTGLISIVFEKPQRAVTPGQAVVFYSDSMVLGGAWIV